METGHGVDAGHPLRAAVELTRPVNLVIVAIGVLAGAMVALGPDLPAIDSALAVVVAVLATAGGNTLNDYVDRELDRTAHPERPLPSGAVTPRTALSLAVAEFGIALPLAWFLNPWAFAVAAVNGSLLVGYELGLKRRGLAGNLVVSYLVGSVFLFGAVAVAPTRIGPAAILFVLATTANLAREVVKDVEDLDADAGTRRTLPMVAGRSEALAFAALALALGVLLSPVPAWMGFGRAYLVVVALADVVLLSAIPVSVDEPGRASTRIKAGMAVGLAAFLAGVAPLEVLA